MINAEEIKKQCKSLWKEAFGDSDEFIAYYFLHYYKHDNMLYIEHDSKLLSMLHIIPFEIGDIPVAYIYAVATSSYGRGKGYASELITRAITKAKAEGYKAVVTLPADSGLHEFYKRFGFEGKYLSRFVTPDGFDFGTGEADKDFTALLTLDECLAVPDEGFTLTYRK